jgi:hypothetical protein
MFEQETTTIGGLASNIASLAQVATQPEGCNYKK